MIAHYTPAIVHHISIHFHTFPRFVIQHPNWPAQQRHVQSAGPEDHRASKDWLREGADKMGHLQW